MTSAKEQQFDKPVISRDLLLKSLDSLADRKVLVVGDVMLDRYVFGTVERISPEAPVPVVRASEERVNLGGAGNVARNIKHLGGSPVLVSVCGVDAEAEMLSNVCNRESIACELIGVPGRQTTVKTRVIAHNQQVVRIDRETTGAIDSATLKALTAAIAAHCADTSVLIISDYAKGTVTPELATSLSLLSAQNPRLHILVDPKPANIRLYERVFLMTPNAAEAGFASGIGTLDSSEKIIAAGRKVLHDTQSANLLITLGPRGMALFQADGSLQHITAQAQQVFDVTGAGDTVIATLGLAIANDMDLVQSSLLANYAAGIVVGEIGAASATTKALNQAIDRLPLPTMTPWNENTYGH